jgi:hypothetical protein
MQDEDWLGRRLWLPDFEAEEAPSEEPTEVPEESRKKRPKRRSSGPSSGGGLAGIIGMLSPWQRFVLALLVFLNVALLGCMCLVMTGRVVPFSP